MLLLLLLLLARGLKGVTTRAICGCGTRMVDALPSLLAQFTVLELELEGLGCGMDDLDGFRLPHPTTWTLLSALGISNPARPGHKPTMTPTFCHITIQCDEHDGIWPTDCTILRCCPSVCDDSECTRPTQPDSPRTSPPANSEDQTWKPTMKPMHRATDANNINVRSSNGGTEDANTGRCEVRLTYECAKGLPLREMIESWP